MTDTTAPPPEPLAGRTFRGRSLRGARFIGCDLGDVVVRGSDLAGLELDSPWLLEGGATLVVNGVDVVGFVDAELDRRFPGRALRTAEDAPGLVAAWDALERTWAATVARAQSLPDGSVSQSVDGEWSFTQTLRHLVVATDVWFGRAILGLSDPFHPLGLPDDSGSDVFAAARFTDADPALADVLDARADRQGQVRAFLAGVTDAQLAEERPNPHAPEHSETVLSCLRTILEEEWEHHRYAVRDLDRVASGAQEGAA